MPEPKSALQLNNLSSSSSIADIINTQSVCQEASLSTFDDEEPTGYAIESKASVVGWENIQIGLLNRTCRYATQTVLYQL